MHDVNTRGLLEKCV